MESPMRSYFFAILSLFIWNSSLSAKVLNIDVETLTASDQQRKTAIIIGKVTQRYHYRKVRLNNDMSERVFDRYIESLDPNKSFFSQKDITSFFRIRYLFDEAIKKGRIEPAFDVFKIFRQRVGQRVDYALDQLEKYNFDFSIDEYYRYDREDAPWSHDQKALNQLWVRRIKNDILSLRLSKKTDTEIKEKLSKRYNAIKDRVFRFDSNDIFQTFVNSYTLTIEPHTIYMSPRGSENFDISMRLSLQGIGAVLREDNEYTVVMRTVVGGPAKKSNQIKSGDRITGVAQGDDGEMMDVVGWRLQDVVDIIRGPKGTVVRLNVLPKSAGADAMVKEVVLVREKIKLEDQAASSEVIEGLEGMGDKKIGVIDIPAFYRDFQAHSSGDKDFRSTTRDVRKILKDLAKQNVDGIIIDLRQNGGGSLTESTELTGLFIKEGPVVQVKEASGNIDVERDPDPEVVYDGPLAVLVDRNSASASEIFSGAIQDYKRGLIIGETTYGKGTVQTLVDLNRFVKGDDDLGRLRLTMAQFFRIDGASTQHKGVVPDIIFPTAVGGNDHGERALENALPWAEVKKVDHVTGVEPQLTLLKQRNQKRVSTNPGFEFLVNLEKEVVDIRNEHTVSLLEKNRKAEWKRRQDNHLKRRNKLRIYRGLEPLAELEKDDDDHIDEEDKEDPEKIERIMLDEAVLILSDMLKRDSSTMVKPTAALAQ